MIVDIDPDSEASKPEREQAQKKIDAGRHRRIPVGKFILLLGFIVLTVIVLEHFI